MLLQDSAILRNLDVKALARTNNSFEKQYIRAREKENRLYDDREVSMLPDISPLHRHRTEWVYRKKSAERLVRHLETKKNPLQILEIGCGNGWLSNRLSKIRGAAVTGQDINFTELQQAARVFSNQSGLRFIYGDVFNGILKEREFNVIVFAASIHYFHSLSRILAFALDHLSAGGEIHIVDTPFYKPSEKEAASQRTNAYYRELGFPEMADHYFHHSVDDLSIFRHRVLFTPHSLLNRICKRKDPFPWICISKK